MTAQPLLDELTATLTASAPYRRLARRPVAVQNLPVPAAAWVAGRLGRDEERPVLAIVPRESDALAWVEAAGLFAGPAVYFSAPSLSPYQEVEASLAVRAAEALALHALAAPGSRGRRAGTVVATPRSLFRRLPTPGALAAAVVEIEPGDAVELDELAAHLTAHGYHRVDLVGEVGELAVRGGIFDLWPPGEEAPLRLDLFGDTVESIRRFDAGDQRSLREVGHLTVLPLTLFRSDGAAAHELADRLEESAGEGGAELARALEALRHGRGFPGWGNYLPALAGDTVSLVDWLGSPLVVALETETLLREIEEHAERLEDEHRARTAAARAALPPETLELPPPAVRAAVEGAGLRVGDLVTPAEAVDFAASVTDLFHGQLPRFPREVETAASRGERLLVVAPPEHHHRVEDLAKSYGVTIGAGGVELVDGELARGFRLPAAGAVLYGEPQLFPRPAVARRPRRSPGRAFSSDLRDLGPGDFVVHEDHGIGQFVGLTTVGFEAPRDDLPPVLRQRARERPEGGEVMEIAYRDGRRLLLPLSRLDQIQKYSGIETVAPRLDTLGGTSWNRRKSRVRRGLRQLAGDLLKLYAERQVARAPAMAPDGELGAAFAAAFDHQETPDQLEAIEAIRRDLEGERPMDRLLCGDVGFGKTEVAMRAAFKVVESGYQVAVLAPTTILADQHAETFARRFDGFPVTVDVVSRFRSQREVGKVRERLVSGAVDVLIGTHRLLSRDIEFHRLGLVVVDEEQRFGVAQKERLKRLKKNVHVLAMSATPVPRTLQLSLAGVRDLSVIETPPRDRMAVETAIMPFSGELVREAIEFELERGGQVFFVHNRVESIEGVSRMLRELVPGVRVTVGHGQLPEQELERRMHAFTRGEHDLLLATTIIENGIDLPNVNTILIHRADRFGLAQLYQLRGRVGRSDRLAYCYLLVPPDRVLSEKGRRRLIALREFSELGAGFRIAARDLEIRGAGNLLGAEQSGHIADVGIETYMKMLEDTVRELRGEEVEEAPSVALDLPAPLSISTEYVADANLRMEVYRKIAAAEVSADDLLSELRDRFGPPPDAVRELIAVADLKRVAERLRVQSISSRDGELVMRLRQDARIDPQRLVGLVEGSPDASFSPAGVLTVRGVDRGETVARARRLLEELSQ